MDRKIALKLIAAVMREGGKNKSYSHSNPLELASYAIEEEAPRIYRGHGKRSRACWSQKVIVGLRWYGFGIFPYSNRQPGIPGFAGLVVIVRRMGLR
jgi:hypothetical protein